MIIRMGALILTGLVLSACGQSRETRSAETGASEAVPGPTVTVARPAGPDAPADYRPRMVDLPFRLDVTLSREVIEALDAADVPLTVEAAYYGRPRLGSDAVPLGVEARQIGARSQSVTLAGEFDAALVAREVAGDARVSVSASAGPEGKPALYCTEFDEALPIAVETGGHIHCELLSN